MMKKFEERSDGLKKRDLKGVVPPLVVDVEKQVELEGEELPEQVEVVKTGRKPRPAAPKADSEFVEKVVSINRITKVTKGGKKLSFSALVVVGDMKGRVGYSLEKASEVSIAIRKAITMAKKSMIVIPMKGTTIPHEIIGVCGAANVLLKPASEGTGVIAAGPVRAICDGAGIRNILTKCHRSNNPVNVVKATIDGLSRLKAVVNQG
jgi:small subunit ribosomal protein S5